MFIVKLHSGLANRMFQYAFYKYLIEAGKEVFIDDYSFSPNRAHEDISIKNIFPNLRYKQANFAVVNKLSDQKDDYFNKFRRKYFNLKLSHFKETKFKFDPSIINFQGNYYLDGFWQSEKYFKDIQHLIRSDFDFHELSENENIKLKEHLLVENSISIHVRKGIDYLQIKKHADVCDINYYNDAVKYIKTHVTDPKFYVFSDNFDWVKENLIGFDFRIIDWNDNVGVKNYRDMQLMSYCKHNIIANSSYSWWAAWLNGNFEKIVISPKKWFNEDKLQNEASDIIPESWLKI